ncbi:unnamed protein product [Protopolystoma xenopodis]|uniref:Ig-like domain-containing protein n=1 Tax=Protopolystoma xenopodis TaxID=117903 RepID=A0A3S5ALH9_9PLAT|nr:unnamed protein product [Protopolystoma xenopodis]
MPKEESMIGGPSNDVSSAGIQSKQTLDSLSDTKEAAGEGKAGSESGTLGGVLSSSASLACLVAGEPSPKVSWTRDPFNKTLVEGAQFRHRVERIQTGIYLATVRLARVTPAELGFYYCHLFCEPSPKEPLCLD